MKVYIATYDIAAKNNYGEWHERRVVGLYTTSAKASKAVKQAVKEAARDICRSKITDNNLSVYQDGDTVEYTYSRKYVNGGYEDIIASVYAEQVQ